ncbi:hypothetical protein F9L33_14535 [Amylibacter sp. SFDW26]|uniref:hypothetical protein n=1 Tax=Amylibacter sp. SFDW26 TaxID=2652722 RepID=UPI0012620EFA|nr:hypothetical protein [Amylibacter sp. SFDW26]KAB7610513.1 hypothetical protein F9L33_14535 [Amylibacter sp. SFDW26]
MIDSFFGGSNSFLNEPFLWLIKNDAYTNSYSIHEFSKLPLSGNTVMSGRLIHITKLLIKALLVTLCFIAALVSVEIIGQKSYGRAPIEHFILHEMPFRGERFSPDLWVDANDCRGLSGEECAEKEATCQRGPMVRDLLISYLTPKVTIRANVISLIGEKEYKTNINGQPCDAYNLGMCSGFRIDYDALYVCYDQKGTVSAAGHVQH